MAYSMVNLLRKSGSMLAASFLAASLTSFAPVPDPSLLAAPPYEPQNWNDLSYEQLSEFYKRHSRAIERTIEVSYKQRQENPDVVFRRKAQTNAEKAFTVITMAHAYISQNPNYQLHELAAAMAHNYNAPYRDMLLVMHSAKDLYKPKGYQQTNNCYAYAVNDRERSFNPEDYQGNPGDRTLGLARSRRIDPYTAKNYAAFVQQTIKGNISDGLIFTGQTMQSRTGFYRVAMYARPIDRDTKNPVEAMDYHYIRQNRDGTWSHKFGALVVTNLDYSEKIITDPVRADMGAYKFIGYFLVPEGGLDVGLPEEKAIKSASRPGFQARPTPS